MKHYGFWYELRELPRNIKNFFLNIYHHRKSLWYSRPWDYTGSYMLLRDNLTYLSNSIEKYGCTLNKDKGVKQMRICIHLIDRLIEDDYTKRTFEMVEGERTKFGRYVTVTSSPKYFLPTTKDHKIEDGIKKHDKDLLFKLLNKHLHTWWD